MTIACLWCQSPLVEKDPSNPRAPVRKYCSERCGQKARQQGKSERKRIKRLARTCKECGVGIGERPPGSVQCEVCYRKKQGMARHRMSPLHQATQRTKTRTTLQRRDPPKLSAPKETAVPNWPPNWDGDWYPGWRGAYSPKITPEAQALIEKHFGPAPVGDPRSNKDDKEGRAA